ncbi:hypothetical protein GY45DRAFT_91094 [Cubamyces sp. BRFM 1775]|nr:hypothetical protein GY45DRAFT_91094 [Cubamyces sp. BRFM 1775]
MARKYYTVVKAVYVKLVLNIVVVPSIPASMLVLRVGQACRVPSDLMPICRTYLSNAVCRRGQVYPDPRMAWAVGRGLEAVPERQIQL